MWELLLMPLTGLANAAIGGDWLTNGLIYGPHFLLTFAILCVIMGNIWWISALAAALTTGSYAWWRSQSPRGADLDLVWEHPNEDDPTYGRERTYEEIKGTAKRHGIPLLIISIITLTWWLPLLVVVPIAAHMLGGSFTGWGRRLVRAGKSRRFGEAVSGTFNYGVALSILASTLTTYLGLI